MAKKKEATKEKKVIQLRVEAVRMIADKTIKYGITQIYDWDPNIERFLHYHSVGGQEVRYGMEEFEATLPPHETDTYSGYLFDVESDAVQAMELYRLHLLEKQENDKYDIEII